LIGDLVAGAACLVAQGLGECCARGKMDGEMSAGTRRQGGELIAGLLEIRQGTAGELDFDAVARSQGRRVLRERNGDSVSDKMISGLVDAVLQIVGRIVRSRLN
jgi:hypothetical protein